MNQHDALIRAVLVSPDDDLPRMVYADHCDENGRPERAEFIRIQCELAKAPPPPLCISGNQVYDFNFRRGHGDVTVSGIGPKLPAEGERFDVSLPIATAYRENGRGDMVEIKREWFNLLATDVGRWEGRWRVCFKMNPGPDDPFRAHRKREVELFNSHKLGWFSAGGAWQVRLEPFPPIPEPNDDGYDGIHLSESGFVVRRGFCETLRTHPSLLLNNDSFNSSSPNLEPCPSFYAARRFFDAHPITKVEMPDFRFDLFQWQFRGPGSEGGHTFTTSQPLIRLNSNELYSRGPFGQVMTPDEPDSDRLPSSFRYHLAGYMGESTPSLGRYYDSVEAGRHYLSNAAVNWGRSLVRLPLLDLPPYPYFRSPLVSTPVGTA